MVRAGHRLVATVGVEDLVVVETKDAVLVAHKYKVQEVKKVVSRIEADGGPPRGGALGRGERNRQGHYW